MNFDVIRQMFGGHLTQPQVDGVNVLLKAWADHVGPGHSTPPAEPILRQQLAYVLATARHETAGTMQPIKEYGLGKGHPYGKVDHTGKAPFGRGYVQLTWDYNYQKADKELGLGGRLAANYDLALEPDIAAQIIVRGMSDGWFTNRKLHDYINADNCDFVDARRIVNGLDRAEIIAGYAKTFLTALG